MDRSLDEWELSKLNQDEINNLSSSRTLPKVEAVLEKFPTQ